MNNAMVFGFAGMILVWFVIQVLPMPSENAWGLHAILALVFLLNLAAVLRAGGLLAWETLR